MRATQLYTPLFTSLASQLSSRIPHLRKARLAVTFTVCGGHRKSPSMSQLISGVWVPRELHQSDNASPRFTVSDLQVSSKDGVISELVKGGRGHVWHRTFISGVP
ncbi:hypothetical protein HPB49_023024 [Dermacentor silvarum]|uniref:Uncharacterized protein n=1 Tax=Dermacentor silvarum TaxID=543639 RepID=A0ACB8D0P7_DERSI|nr:hypothetical protein HPB49_023024 [Dermacentor silvarum]